MLITSPLKIWLSNQPIDMRKGIDGLCFLIVDAFNLTPSSGELFLFYNRQFNKLKILYWDKNGFCLWYKRLEKTKLKIPFPLGTKLQISQTQLRWLLDGLDFTTMTEIKSVEPIIFF